MKVKLPKLIETYIQASNEINMEAYLSCFTETATVMDDGETLTGHDAIAAWLVETQKKYHFTNEATGVKESTDQIILTVKSSGTFPGTPLSFDYHMNLKSGLIHALRIELTK